MSVPELLGREPGGRGVEVETDKRGGGGGGTVREFGNEEKDRKKIWTQTKIRRVRRRIDRWKKERKNE